MRISGGVVGYFGFRVETLQRVALLVGPGDPRMVATPSADHHVLVAKPHSMGGAIEW